jgi:hypothetical protein
MAIGGPQAVNKQPGGPPCAVNAAMPGAGEAGAVCKMVDAEAIARSSSVAEQVRQQVFDVLANGADICATLHTDGDASRAIAALQAACRILERAATDAGVAPARLEILVDNPEVTPAEAAAIRRDTVGDGVVHIVADSNRLRGSRGRDAVRARFWDELWQASARNRLRVAYAAPVCATSALLRSEPATSVLPRTHIEVPAGTAWVQLQLNLSSLRRRGALCTASLEDALRRSVTEGERLHDSAAWLTPAMRDDAWLNRRIAIVIDGIGDLVIQEGMDPSAFSTLEFLDRLLRRLQVVARDHSRTMARRTAHVPALDQTDPCRFLPRGAVRDTWHRRWTEVLATAGVRHRNLLAMSPWAVFPVSAPADFRFADLLPLLRYADACMLAGTRDLRDWNVSKFKEFHCRASAALQQRESRHQIAEGC